MCGLHPKLSLKTDLYCAVLLDFDGTLVPTEKVFLQSWQEVFERRFQCNFSKEEYIKYELEQDSQLIDYLILNRRLASINSAVLMQAVYENYELKFREMLNKCNFTRTLEYLFTWYTLGIKLCIVSTSRRKYIEMFFERYQKYKNMFSCIYCREDVSKLKPDPTIYLLAANDLKVLPEKCVVVEDSLKGIEGAMAAQMKVIRVLINSISIDEFTPKYNVPTVRAIENITFEV